MFGHEVFQYFFLFSLLPRCQLITRINLRMGRIHSRNLGSYGRWNISHLWKFSCHGVAGLSLLFFCSLVSGADILLTIHYLLFRIMIFLHFMYVISQKYLDK